MNSVAELARRTPVFQALSEDEATKLLSRATLKEAGRGASIHLQGERAHSFFVILEGWVKLYRISPCGNEAIVGILTRGESFGECSAIKGEVYSTGAETASETRLIQIDGACLGSAIDANPGLCRAILSATLSGNRQLVHQVEQLKSHTSAQRIASFLLELCRDEIGSCTVILPYDKVLIAGWLGMKPESLSRSFRRLEAFGVKIKKNRATIASIERLHDFAEENTASSWSMGSCAS